MMTGHSITLFSVMILILMLNLSHITSSSLCSHPIWCDEDVLHKVQMAELFADQKTFVDRPLIVSPENWISQFRKLPENVSPSQLLNFVMATTSEPDDIFQHIVPPPDWVENPPYIDGITQGRYKKFALGINQVWKDLYRQFDTSRYCKQCTSAITVPHPFIISGERFKEYYYWDLYWSIEGVLLSDMKDTAKGMVENMLYLIDKIGYIPNGGRIYYLDRSQPPLAALSVWQYVKMTGDESFLKMALPILIKEYEYWMKEKSVRITVGDDAQQVFVLNRYKSLLQTPRPESYKHDVVLAEKITDINAKKEFYTAVASAAESGWDFSSRWFEKERDMKTIQTHKIIPLDLNSILYRNEIIISSIAQKLNLKNIAEDYFGKSQQRYNAMVTLLYNHDTGLWHDYNYETKTLIHQDITTGAQFMPYWAGIYAETTEPVDPKSPVVSKVRDALKKFLDNAGFPATSLRNGQQWDYPNAWAPIQWFLVETLAQLQDVPEIYQGPIKDKQLIRMAERWLNSVLCAWERTNAIYEKYDSHEFGEPGHGGEYTVQRGFGWTNGVALRFMIQFNDSLTLPECPKK